MIDICMITTNPIFESIPYFLYCIITSYLDLNAGTFSYGCTKCPDN